MAVNPRNSKNAIITANDYGAQENPILKNVHRLWGSWWVTQDAGAHWTRHTLPGMLPDAGSTLSGYAFVGDLVVTFGSDGRAYLAGIAYTVVSHPAAPVALYRNALFLATSEDAGDTFSEPQLVDSKTTEVAFHDKPALAVDGHHRLFLVWNFIDSGQRGAVNDQGMRVAVSDDGAKSWRTDWLSRNDFGISASIAIDADGEVNVAWRSYDPYAIRFSRSTDHGATFSAPSLLASLTEMDLVLPNTRYRAFVLPTLVSAKDGALLCVYADRGEQGDSDIFLSRSIDDGKTWDASRLNQDATATAQFLPTIASGTDGRVV
ncbi:MAG TPA: sialidase family protein, partial [Burkholderiales bacterium]|nr:sialidase family protein [Burkholderiales bacterium]